MSVCSVCSRLTGFGDEDKGEPPVNLARCAAPGGLECRAVAQAVAPWRRENETLRSNCDHLSSENASLASQVESMGMRIESLAEELAKPEDVRLREVIDALDGRFPIFDSIASRVSAALDEAEEFIARAGEAERTVEAARRRLSCVAETMSEHAYQELASALEAPPRIEGKTAGFDQPGLPLPPDVVAKAVEADRLRKLFDDARLRAVRKLLEYNGCDCPCDHHPDERGPDCEICLACLIGEAVGK